MPKTSKQLKATIKAIHTASGNLQERIHTCACDILEYAGLNNDASLIADFAYGMPQGQRVTTLRKWFEEFGPIKFDVEKKETSLVSVKKTGREWRIADAKANPYYAFLGQERAPVKLSLAAMVAIINRFDKKLEKAVAEDRLADGEDVERIQKFIKTMNTAAQPFVKPEEKAAA